MKARIIILLIVAISFGSNAQLLQKVVTKVAKVSGGAMGNATGMISTTNNLDDITIMTGVSSKVYPKEVKTAEIDFLEGWQSGADMVFLFFSKKNTMGMCKIDGKVLVDGKPANYASIGTYSYFSQDNFKARTVEISTTSGQHAKFTMAPPTYQLKIHSINGKSENIALDLTKDVVIELDEGPIDANLLRVRMVGTAVGIRGFYEVGNFKAGKTITIPPAFFRNLNISPGNKAFMNFKNSFLLIEYISSEKATDVSGMWKEIEYLSTTSDGKFIKVEKGPELNTGITISDEKKFDGGEMTAEYFKPNAFLSRPLDQVSKIAVTSFSIRGTTYFHKETEDRLQQTRTSRELTFPTQSDETWEKVLDQFYKGLKPVFEEELKAGLMPIEEVTALPAYQMVNSYSSDDANTTINFSKGYKDLKVLSVFMPISESYGKNNLNNRILKDAAANATLNFTLDLQLGVDDKDRSVMKPILGIELIGGNNGDISTKYFTMKIEGEGYRLSRKETITPEVISKIVRQEDFLAMIKKGIKEIKAKELENQDYKIVWSLQ